MPNRPAKVYCTYAQTFVGYLRWEWTRTSPVQGYHKNGRSHGCWPSLSNGSGGNRGYPQCSDMKRQTLAIWAEPVPPMASPFFCLLPFGSDIKNVEVLCGVVSIVPWSSRSTSVWVAPPILTLARVLHIFCGCWCLFFGFGLIVFGFICLV